MSFAEPECQNVLGAECRVGDLSNLLVSQGANPRAALEAGHAQVSPHLKTISVPRGIAMEGFKGCIWPASWRLPGRRHGAARSAWESAASRDTSPCGRSHSAPP